MPTLHSLTPYLRLRHASGCAIKAGRYFIYDYYSVPRYISFMVYLLMVLLERLGLLAAGRVFPKIVSISEGVLEQSRSTGSETFSL